MIGRYYKWLLLLLLSGAFFFHQADRALFGLLTIPIQNELGLSDVQIGWINTVLSWTLACMAFVAGPVGDRFSRKWIITFSLMAWSLMTFMMGYVGVWHLFGITIPAFFTVMFFRSIATGVGESFYGPCYPPIIAAFHKSTRSIALSIHQGSLYAGLMTSGVITAWTLGFFRTWRNVFMVFGTAGFLLGVLFIFCLKDTGSDEEAGKKPADANDPRTGIPFLDGFAYFFRTPTAICAMTGFIAIVFVNNAYLFWAPKFMSVKFGVSVGEAGTQSMLWHHLAAFAAIIAGGLLTDRMVGRFPRFRLLLQISALLGGAPCLVLAGCARSTAAFVLLSAAYGVFRGAFEVNTHATLFDVIPPRHRSTSVGIFTVFAFFFGGLSGVLMGALSEAYGVRGFEIGFAILGCAYVFAALVMIYSYCRTFLRDRYQYAKSLFPGVRTSSSLI